MWEKCNCRLEFASEYDWGGLSQLILWVKRKMKCLCCLRPVPKHSVVALLVLEKSSSLWCFVGRDGGAIREQAHSFNIWKTLVSFTDATEGTQHS